MGLELFIGIGAFVVLCIMMILLHISSLHDEDDPITQELMIIKHESATQEERH